MNESLEPPLLSPSFPLWTNRESNRSVRIPLFVVVGSTIVVLGFAAILFFFDPRQYGFYPKCPLYTLTGLHCPGCGALRGLHELMHGHLLVAVRMNSLLFPGLPALGSVYLYQRLRNKHVATVTVLQ